MASEYLLKKAKEEAKPRETRVLTKAEKRRNWWDYHKWHVVICVAAALVLAEPILRLLGVGQVEPDYSIAYVGSAPLSEETAAALIDALTGLSPDLNGDGEVKISLQQYITGNTGDPNTLYDARAAQAAQIQLVADISECTSYFFLLEDPKTFQESISVLCNLDGSLPDDEDLSSEGKYLLWGDCPALARLDLGADLSRLAFARRGFWTEKTVPNADQCGQLWARLTEGADRKS